VNLRRVRAIVDGVTRRLWVCARCLRSGKVEKPAVRRWRPEEAKP
jgi:large subunit ribosomal protein L28